MPDSLVVAIISCLAALASCLGAVRLYFKAKADNESATRHRKEDHENMDSRVMVLEENYKRLSIDVEKRFDAGEKRFEKQDLKLDQILQGVNGMQQQFENFKGYVNGLEEARKQIVSQAFAKTKS